MFVSCVFINPFWIRSSTCLSFNPIENQYACFHPASNHLKSCAFIITEFFDRALTFMKYLR